MLTSEALGSGDKESEVGMVFLWLSDENHILVSDTLITNLFVFNLLYSVSSLV